MNEIIFVLQSEYFLTKEKRIVEQSDYKYKYCSYKSDLSEYKNHVPVGTVEFVTKFAKENEIFIPLFPTYPIQLHPFLKRNLDVVRFKEANINNFVKPVETKAFTGGIKFTIIHSTIEQVSPDELCYEVPPINFTFEWRCYIIDKQIVGVSRYDDSDEYADLDIKFVEDMIEKFDTAPIGYALDVGLTDSGEYMLIEANDGWSLGFYPWGNMKPESYLKLIISRWEELEKLK